MMMAKETRVNGVGVTPTREACSASMLVLIMYWKTEMYK